MQERHKDRQRYFEEQAYTTQKYVIPFVSDFMPITKACAVLEVGCGEGGNLKPFVDLGCKAVGIDLNRKRIEEARVFYENHPNKGQLQLVLQDIYEVNPSDFGQFDLIIMRDVIEHIHNQERFMEYIKQFLKPNGTFFLGFPPWYMPFGGHQQICKTKLSKLPYFHLLPMPLYKALLRAFGEPASVIDDLVEIKMTGISIERFDKILKASKYKVRKKVDYLINPNYEVKFKLQPRKQLGFIKHLPFFRNFLTTCSYYLISK